MRPPHARTVGQGLRVLPDNISPSPVIVSQVQRALDSSRPHTVVRLQAIVSNPTLDLPSDCNEQAPPVVDSYYEKASPEDPRSLYVLYAIFVGLSRYRMKRDKDTRRQSGNQLVAVNQVTPVLQHHGPIQGEMIRNS